MSVTIDLTRSDLFRLCGNNVSVARLDAALGALLAARRATREMVHGERGRPAETWRLTPAAAYQDDWDDCIGATKETKETKEVGEVADGGSILSSHSFLSSGVEARPADGWEGGEVSRSTSTRPMPHTWR